MLKQPRLKYRPFVAVPLSDRTWPDQNIEHPPIWASSCLRDGNQSIFEPMNIEKKTLFFDMLKKIGFKEIEVGFPSSSSHEYDFIRKLIEEKRVPNDVNIGAVTPAIKPLIHKTVESLKGAKQAIVHLYIATSKQFRNKVFNQTKEEVLKTAVSSTKLIRNLTKAQPNTNWTLEFSPETFSQTEAVFARDVCNAVTKAWSPTAENKIILNLPATVEVCQPNQFADKIEWMSRNLVQRDSIVLSVHPHNDRGTAVAATEMALLAGAERVEGCLLGNGERTGNVDLVTLALNMYTQGIHPNLDFSRLEEIKALVETCTGILTHPRHPYAGDFVFTAFSGTHQAAIKKGMEAQKDSEPWDVPYLPLDPKDLGRTYDNIIRVNSQSGKGGISYLLKENLKPEMPRRLQIEFSNIVQPVAEEKGGEITAEQIWDIFKSEYIDDPSATLRYVSHKTYQIENGNPQGIELILKKEGQEIKLRGKGNGIIDATVNALNLPLGVHDYEQKSMGQGSRARAVSFLEMTVKGHAGTHFGVSLHEDTATSNILAIISGVNRAIKQGKVELGENFGSNCERGNNFHPSPERKFALS